MGVDRHEYIRQKCLCGAGTLAVDFCLPDHPWAPANAGSFQMSINCEQCNQEYALVEQRTQAIIVQRAELKERKAEEQAYYARTKEVSDSESVLAYLRVFEQVLTEVKTATEKHLLFEQAGMFRPSIRAFRIELERYPIAEVIRRNFHLEGMPSLVKLIGREDAELSERRRT